MVNLAQFGNLRWVLLQIKSELQHTQLLGGPDEVTMEDLTQRKMPYLHGFIFEACTTIFTRIFHNHRAARGMWFVVCSLHCRHLTRCFAGTPPSPPGASRRQTLHGG